MIKNYKINASIACVTGLMCLAVNTQATAGQWRVVEDFSNGALRNSRIVDNGAMADFSLDASRSSLVIKPAAAGAGAARLRFNADSSNVSQTVRGIRVELSANRCQTGERGQVFLRVRSDVVHSMKTPRGYVRSVGTDLDLGFGSVSASSLIFKPGVGAGIPEGKGDLGMTSPIKNNGRVVVEIKWTGNSMSYEATRAGGTTHQFKRKAKRRMTPAEKRRTQITVGPAFFPETPSNCTIRINRILGFYP